MSATRDQMLIQAQRNIDLAFLMAEVGEIESAVENMAAARSLIFEAQQSTPLPSRRWQTIGKTPAVAAPAP